MIKLVNHLFQIGVREEYPAYVNKKIGLSNQVACGAFIVAVAYIPFTLHHYRPILFLPALALVAVVLGFILQLIGSIYLSRMLTAVWPLLLTAAYHAYITPQSAGPLPSLYVIQLSLSLIPFLVFDLRERAYLIGASLVCLLAMATFDESNAWLEMKLDAAALNRDAVDKGGAAIAVLIGYACVGVLAYLNVKSEQSGDQWLKEMDARNALLKESEEKLKANLQTVAQTQVEEKKRNWATEGLAELSIVLRTTDDMQKMGDTLLSRLVKYLGANQGGFYVVEEEGTDTRLVLISCYAFERKKFVNQRLVPGQGLIGQAYLDKDHIYLTEIPEDYVSITSGLGKANPTALLIMPLQVNDKVEGLFEIASFKPFESYEIAFLQKLGESVAVTIRTSRVNAKTKTLLAETQEMAEQMRAQEEEVRQNLEEMMATQEHQQRLQRELKENEEKMNEKVLELEQAKAVLETKEIELRAISEKSQKRSAQFKDRMEALDAEMENKDAQMYVLKKANEELLAKIAHFETKLNTPKP